jgi:hypothetical protein
MSAPMHSAPRSGRAKIHPFQPEVLTLPIATKRIVQCGATGSDELKRQLMTAPIWERSVSRRTRLSRCHPETGNHQTGHPAGITTRVHHRPRPGCGTKNIDNIPTLCLSAATRLPHREARRRTGSAGLGGGDGARVDGPVSPSPRAAPCDARCSGRGPIRRSDFWGIPRQRTARPLRGGSGAWSHDKPAAGAAVPRGIGASEEGRHKPSRRRRRQDAVT